jgi:hypothetical protein
MIYLLLLLIPIGALLAWAAVWGPKRLRRKDLVPDVDAAARGIRRDAELKRQRWSRGSGWGA